MDWPASAAPDHFALWPRHNDNEHVGLQLAVKGLTETVSERAARGGGRYQACSHSDEGLSLDGLMAWGYMGFFGGRGEVVLVQVEAQQLSQSMRLFARMPLPMKYNQDTVE